MNCQLMIWARRVRVVLTAAERLVLIYLAECLITSNSHLPSAAVIAADNQMSLRTATAAIRTLTEVGLLRIGPENGKRTYSLNEQIEEAKIAESGVRHQAKIAQAKFAHQAKIAYQNGGIPTRTLVVPETLTGEILPPGNKCSVASLRESTAPPAHDLFGDEIRPSARKKLYDEGIPIITQLTGVMNGQARALLGSFVKDAHDDCAIALDALHEALDGHPINPIPWIRRAIQVRQQPKHRRGEMVLMPDGSRVPTGGF